MGCRPVAPQEEGAKMPPLQPMVVVPQRPTDSWDCNCLVPGRSPLLLFSKHQAESVTLHFT